MSTSPRAAAWTKRLALAAVCAALLGAAAAAAAEVGFFLAQSSLRGAVASGAPAESTLHASFAEARLLLVQATLALTIAAVVALLVQGVLHREDPAARRLALAAPLLAAGAVLLVPAVDARTFLLGEETRSLARLPFLLLPAAGALLLAWPGRAARVVALAGAAALVAGAVHAALRPPSLAGPMSRLPNFAVEAAWGVLAWTLLAVALGLALARDAGKAAGGDAPPDAGDAADAAGA